MESLSFLKFWKNTTHEVNEEEAMVEEEESFFELEITMNKQEGNNSKETEDFQTDPYKNAFKNEHNIGRRILPIEPTSTKPQSPISILKSAPKFKVSLFKKPKTEQPNKTELKKAEQQQPMRTNGQLQNSSKLQKQSSKTEESFLQFDSSKRFPKDVLQKYLKLVRPFHIKVSKGYSQNKVRLADLIGMESPAKSPVPEKNPQAGFRMVCRHLGKSRSASAAVGMVLPVVSRRDDSLLQQDDGIQSAIMHCKRSFTSSRESSLLSGVDCNPSQNKPLESPRISIEEQSAAII